MKTIAIFGLLVFVGGVALADHPTREQLEEVKQLSHELEVQVGYMLRLVREGSHYSTVSEQNAIYNLESFYRDVAQFHQNMESCTDPSQTERDYRRMYSSYCQAMGTIGAFHNDGNIEYYQGEIDRLMQQLTYYYGNSGGSASGDKIQQLRSLAHEVEEMANRLYQTETAYGTTSYAMTRLSQLVSNASSFHRLLESSSWSRSDFSNSYNRLVRTYESIRYDLGNFDRQSCTDYEYIGQLLSSIRSIYEDSPSQGRRHHWRYRY